MPNARRGDGSNGRVRVEGTNGKPPSSQSTQRFPLVVVCTHRDGSELCLQTRCPYHLEHRGYGEHRLTPTRDCALMVANEGEHTLDEVAEVLGVSAEYVRKLEARALEKLRRSAPLYDLEQEE
jgi:DNA-binding CsgD family transcriptional regulator